MKTTKAEFLPIFKKLPYREALKIASWGQRVFHNRYDTAILVRHQNIYTEAQLILNHQKAFPN